MRTQDLSIVIAASFGLACLSNSAAAYTVYISNEKGNSITVIDSATLEVQTTIQVGQRPRGIVLTKDGKHLLICASDNDTVQILDIATKKIVGDLPLWQDHCRAWQTLEDANDRIRKY